ncbi:MAG: HAMP domain-containing histidine kinase, partial [Candidatus Tectomicrobia bacterium]|nr:HAMP domain-containing histidine kinase [Candidatus Tectomicrobia bacterium]
ETRTPLNGIIGPAELIREDPEMDTEERTMMLDMVLKSADRLHVLLNKAVTLGAMKSGSYEWQRVTYDLGHVVRAAVCNVACYAEECQVEIEPKLSDVPLFLLDIGRVEETLRALLENAIRFSPTHGHVAICVHHDQEHACVRVTDAGEGINPAFLSRIFDEFSALDIRHHAKGQGLSLAIARQVVLAHNGTIGVESVPGTETTFTIRLPCHG